MPELQGALGDGGEEGGVEGRTAGREGPSDAGKGETGNNPPEAEGKEIANYLERDPLSPFPPPIAQGGL